MGRMTHKNVELKGSSTMEYLAKRKAGDNAKKLQGLVHPKVETAAVTAFLWPILSPC